MRIDGSRHRRHIHAFPPPLQRPDRPQKFAKRRNVTPPRRRVVSFCINGLLACLFSVFFFTRSLSEGLLACSAGDRRSAGERYAVSKASKVASNGSKAAATWRQEERGGEVCCGPAGRGEGERGRPVLYCAFTSCFTSFAYSIPAGRGSGARGRPVCGVHQALSLFALLVPKYEYWRREVSRGLHGATRAGKGGGRKTQFTCFTSTKVKILAQRGIARPTVATRASSRRCCENLVWRCVLSELVRS